MMCRGGLHPASRRDASRAPSTCAARGSIYAYRTVRIVVAVYFAYLACVAIARRKPRPAFLSVATLLAVFIVGMPHIMPLVYLLVGYWLPALTVREPNVWFEQRLLDIDRRLFGAR